MKKFIKFMNSNIIMNKFINSIIMLPTPLNINMWWNFGSILGMMLLIQIISGLFLSMHYCPNINYAFESMIHIMKDVNYGWIIRLIHMNGASFYFIMMYIHISRNLYYNSYKLTHVWMIGVSILFISMATAFLGYVLPWGQMSFWGATVITNLLSALPFIGQMIVEWIWGGFSINNATLNRFFSLHFLLPFIILLLVIMHLFFLHSSGSSNPLGTNSNYYKIYFYPYFLIKDLLMMLLILLFFFIIILQNPYYLGDPDNFKIANSMVTPTHIKPEWYFLFAYSILRSITNKLGGVIALFMSIMILYFMPFMMNYLNKSNKFYKLNQFMYWLFINNFILLTWLGGQLIEYPYITLNKIITTTYFLYFLFNKFLYNFWDNLLKK
uniref:Cytochrome b n=5 Tax=Apoidea TaxID=34735 RepID=A0A343DRF1_9HYME|nr:cytochrome b [Xylocopa appendiculata]